MPQPRRKHAATRRSVEVRRSGGPSMRRLVRRRVRARTASREAPGPLEDQIQPSGNDSVPRQSHKVGPAGCASVLLGITTAMVIVGLTARYGEVFGERGLSRMATTHAVIGATLVTLAIGVHVPQHFALWVCTAAWRRFLLLGRPSGVSNVILSPGGSDRPLHWVVLSVIALVAGIVTALLPINVRLGGAAYDWMHVRFLWSIGSLVVLQAVVLFLTGLLPLTVLGLAVSCVHRLSCPYGRWDTRATAWLLAGAAGGTSISTWTTKAGVSGDLMMIAAALPVLVVSLVSAASSAPRRDCPQDTTQTEVMPLPISSDRWPTLLRASIVSVGGGGAWVMIIWIGFFAEVDRHTGPFVSAMLVAMGIGVLAGCRPKHRGLRSIGGFGVACAAAGILVALSTVALPGALPVGLGGAVLPACLGVTAIGLATAYGRQTLLDRAASRSRAGATILTRMLVCAALVIWVAAPVAERMMGRPATLLALALSLLSLGGTLIICDPSRSPRTQWARLWIVFGSIAALVALVWLTPNQW